MKTRVLFVDDDRSLCETLAVALSRRDFDVTWRISPEEALAVSAAEDFDVVVTDLQMKGMNGIELCARFVANRGDVPVVVLTAFGNFETAVAAIRAGAYDFLSKPVQAEALAIALRRAAQTRALHDEVKRLRGEVQRLARTEGPLLGRSPAMEAVRELLARIAGTDASVLITGESGTGKELAARALHRQSARSEGPFVPVNCAAMPEALLESELFGHSKGAFTDAKRARPGLFAAAHKGTLFLDEIGEMPLGLQPKLLRALQERAVRPVGATAEVPIDVRVVSATNRDLETAIEERRFREDLFFRINVIHVAMPPLRARVGDILPLSHHFALELAARAGKDVKGISPGAAEKLVAYTWPGNVRELGNCIERAVALARFDQIVAEDLSEKIRNHRPSRMVLDGDGPADFLPMEEVERRYILRVLDALAGNKTAAARVLGIERKTLYRKLERYGADPGKPD